MEKRVIPNTALIALFLILSSLSFLPTGRSIWMNLPPSGTKCVSEEIQTNVVVLADYTVISEDHTQEMPHISVKVTSPYGNNLHHTENVTHGQFAFTTNEAGNYLACFWLESHVQGSVSASVNLDWRIGVAAKDWDSVARKEKIEGVELELRKLEGAVEAIHENLLFLKSREADMREVSELTNSRVAWFSIFSLGVCIIVSGLQEHTIDVYVANLLNNQFDSFEIVFGRARKFSFDDVHPKVVKLVSYMELLLDGHDGAGGLFVVAKGGVKNSDVVGV